MRLPRKLWDSSMPVLRCRYAYNAKISACRLNAPSDIELYIVLQGASAIPHFATVAEPQIPYFYGLRLVPTKVVVGSRPSVYHYLP